MARKNVIIVLVVFLLSANIFQMVDRYLLTAKLVRAYKAQIAFERATDEVIELYSRRIADLYAGKCGTE